MSHKFNWIIATVLGGEFPFAIERYIQENYDDALKLSETRHVLVEKDFTKIKDDD
ncbi:MAG: hypothetical protein Q8O88_03555 [bacterium]|nr:hypothetical protein [bacterium]